MRNLKCITASFLFLEIWLLLFWEEENSILVHIQGEVKTALPVAVSNECVATFKAKNYTGRIAGGYRLVDALALER